MIPELGHFVLVLAMAVAFAQAALGLYGPQLNDARLMAMTSRAAGLQLVLLAASFAALTHAFVTSDFSVINVYENSHSAKPMIYKISGVWGNHEGSMLLWILILAIFGGSVAAFGSNLPDSLKARVLGVQGLIGAVFALFVVLASNPFIRLDPAPINGTDLNPLLQDPGLAFHPPFLYGGYVGLSVAFSFAAAALIEGRVDAAWARWVRPWALAAWASLTVGIALGSWWAYYELGWGGYWFWDPVENASLMPWLAATALLHSAIVVEKRGALKSWTVLLAVLAFSLSLLGTFLVRSGVLTSVHAFAVDPERGLFILGILIFFIGGALALYAWRAPTLKLGGLFAPVSRESALVVNNLLFTAATAAVLIGTLYPLVLEGVTGEKISVGPPFFNATFTPIILPLLVLVPFGPMLAWKRADAMATAQRLYAAAVIALAVGLIALFVVEGAPVLAALGLALATWLVAGAVVDLAERARVGRIPFAQSLNRLKGLPRSAWGTAIAHAGVGVLVFGVVGVTAGAEERVELMSAGQSIEIGGYEVVFEGVQPAPGPNYEADRGIFTLKRGGQEVGQLFPEKRFYPVARMPTTEAAIRTTILDDVYVVLGDPQPGAAPGETRWIVRAYHNPLQPLVWIGCIVMVLGACVSLADRRLRVGAPSRKSRVQPAGAAAE
ncbi:heme lyase CcmF/NrfE family subunit [Pyruvatibacter mobilis]|uniref:Heme lyase CcmF/NrfE family subunit n=1 Tax=Pyruvatibacter mobilis TaxID=1712261 RepID=A0A845QAA2_9HYPH|nr:heme lyase CcmF/NrfE family subunit [Pyruvatibacter mobilis]NBG95394.1 heme lyase CcmF/NrfE family subunit [Pyruvatibacter mobilis]QJD75512.1 heme lyase CcmF/NrfE family subunit [Pyruvatibacter mobilis]GGD16245.1 c-type cytochrome biogenesis protein CcmF [Pyruvatibacter mobilis]